MITHLKLLQTDIFSGVDLKECYNFDMGNVEQNSDFGKFLNTIILLKLKNSKFNLEFLLLLIGITLYHALTDGGQFDWAQVLLSDDKVLQ